MGTAHPTVCESAQPGRLRQHFHNPNFFGWHRLLACAVCNPYFPMPDILPGAEPQDVLTGALRRHFAFDRFRAGQREIIEAVLAGRSTVAILPPAAVSPCATNSRRC